MSQSNSNTIKNLEAAFGGESMANRKYLFFADIARKLGFAEVSKLFRETANQETEHAFAHFRLLHPELSFDDAEQLSEEQKKAILAKCLELAIEGETYEYTTMYPEFTEQAIQDRDHQAVTEFKEQEAESREHAAIFRKAAQNFGFLTSIENHHANQYTEALNTLGGEEPFARKESHDPKTQKWICRQCSMIYDSILGDLDSGIQPGTAFEDIPDDWQCPICGAVKKPLCHI
jgi:rubrerythrin